MEGDPANLVDEIPERFVPEAMHGQLIEAEHLSRYWWASGLVQDKRVLDAGCGTAYGASILAGAGARRVVGVDVAKSVLEAVRPTVHPSVELEVADVRELPFERGSFDIAVCFEMIEHLDDPEAAIGELKRVLVADGLVAVSSPNRREYVSGNPHHRHEFLPEELEDLLARHFGHVRLLRQHDWLAAAVLADDAYAAEDAALLENIDIRKAVGREPGSELYTVALATNGDLPEPPGCGVLTHATEVRNWVGHFAEQQSMLADQADMLSEFRAAKSELFEVTKRLELAETQLAAVPALEQARDDAIRESRERAARARELEDELHAKHGELVRAHETLSDLQQTRLWRLGSAYWRFRDRLVRRR